MERQELMRVDADGQTISLLAPFAGTVARFDFRLGDTVPPGQTAVTVGDLSQFQIETTDLDEFTVGRVHEGQPAAIRFDALDVPPVHGMISRISDIAQTRSTGEVTYPAVIDFEPPAGALRWGMTARITFEE
jgi:multidrug resistance efflux pump